MIKIRLRRIGRKGVNAFRVVAVDSKRKRDSKATVEDFGYYAPQSSGAGYLKIDLEKVKKCLATGGQATERVIKLIKIAENNEQYNTASCSDVLSESS